MPGPVQICYRTEHLLTPRSPKSSSSTAASGTLIYKHHTHKLKVLHRYDCSCKSTCSAPIIDLISLPLATECRSDEVFCQYIVFSCRKVPGKMIREWVEKEDERLEGMREKLSKNDREVAFSGGV